MTGNGIRAARRKKVLSRPLADGKAPPFTLAIGSGVFLRRHANGIERRVIRDQLAVMTNNFNFSDDLYDVVVETVREKKPKKKKHWMYHRAHRCGAVHITECHVYFHRRRKITAMAG